MGRAVPAVSRALDILELFLDRPSLTAPQIIGLKQTSDQQQVHGTWCIDGTSADDVAKQIGHSLAQAKYTGLSIRGDAKKAGVSGDRDGIRFSMVVSASSAAVCAPHRNAPARGPDGRARAGTRRAGGDRPDR